jgi:catechol 2,3-dioxygenase-like lactoylglutathione lyase family enzyme
MLGETEAFATIAVRDGQKAKAFYHDKLGLDLVDERPGASTYSSGGSKVLVYESEYAGTNKATAATWAVKNLDEVVRDLKSKGVAFEHYDNLPGLKVEGDVHVGGDMRIAWLKDPDGNILSIYGAH